MVALAPIPGSASIPLVKQNGGSSRALSDTPGGIASPSAPPNWDGVPRLESPIADTATGQITIPWYNFMIFLCARASFIQTVQESIDVLVNQVDTAQTQIGTLQGQVSTLQGQVATLQGQTATQAGQIAALQAEDTNLQNQINGINNANFQGQINAVIDRLNRAGIPP